MKYTISIRPCLVLVYAWHLCIHRVYIETLPYHSCIQIVYIIMKWHDAILLDVYLMYTKYVHITYVIQIMYTFCIQKVYHSNLNFGKGHGWVARICQPSERSPSRSWLPIVEAPGFLRHPTST